MAVNNKTDKTSDDKCTNTEKNRRQRETGNNNYCCTNENKSKIKDCSYSNGKIEQSYCGYNESRLFKSDGEELNNIDRLKKKRKVKRRNTVQDINKQINSLCVTKALPHMSATDELLRAASENDCEKVLNLLENNSISINNAMTSEGDAPLHFIAMNGCLKCCSNLLSYQADPNTQNHIGITPLMLSCERGNVDICEELLQQGASAESINHYGETALHIATSVGHFYNFNCTKMLLNYGANLNVQTHLGVTPLHVLVYTPSVESSLSMLTEFIKYGARADIHGRFPHVYQGEPITPFELALLLTNVAAVVVFTEAGYKIPGEHLKRLLGGSSVTSYLHHHMPLQTYICERLSQPKDLMLMCKNTIVGNLQKTNDLEVLNLPGLLLSYIQNKELYGTCKVITEDLVQQQQQLSIESSSSLEGTKPFKVTDICF